MGQGIEQNMRGGGRTPLGVGPDSPRQLPVCAQRVLKTRPRRATILLSLATSGRHSAENTALPGRLTHSLFVKLPTEGASNAPRACSTTPPACGRGARRSSSPTGTASTTSNGHMRKRTNERMNQRTRRKNMSMKRKGIGRQPTHPSQPLSRDKRRLKGREPPPTRGGRVAF